MRRGLPAAVRVGFVVFLLAVIVAVAFAFFRGAVNAWWAVALIAAAVLLLAAIRGAILAIFRANEVINERPTK